MVLLGAIVSYCEVFIDSLFVKIKILSSSNYSDVFQIIPMYFQPSYLTCTIAQVFQLEGFLLAYGALVLKTWR
jgi:hypothetical protein